MRIVLTEEDVLEGEQDNPWQCAIVKAFHRMYPQYTAITVGRGTIGLSDKRVRSRYEVSTPRNAAKFQQVFDPKNGGRDAALALIRDKGVSFEIRLDEAEITPMPEPKPGSGRRKSTGDTKATTTRASRRRMN